jgi:hypothetical protein
MRNIMNSASIRSIIVAAKHNDEGRDEPTFENDVEFIRNFFEGEDGRNRTLKLSDTVLDMVVSNCKNPAFEDMETEDQLKLLERAEQEAANVGISDPAISELAQIFNEDDTANEELNECIEAVRKSKTTAVNMYAQFHRLYTLDQLNSFPRPGWTEEDVAGTNYKPDIVKTKDKVSGNPVTTVWMDDFIFSLGRGKELSTQIDEVRKELKTTGSVPRLSKLSKKALETMKSDLTSQFNALTSMVKRAIDLHHAFEAVSGMEKVVIEWCRGDEKDGIAIPSQFGTGKLGKDAFFVTRAPRPLWIYPKGEASEGKNLSVTQLINFNVAEAIKNGGTFADLFKTLERGNGDGNEGDGDGSDWDEDQAYEGLSKVANFFSKRDKVAMLNKILADRKHPERNDWLENVGEIYFRIKSVYNKYRSEIEEITGGDHTEQKQTAA